jgi:hypothetical protein
MDVETLAQTLIAPKGVTRIIAMNVAFIASDHFVIGKGAVNISFIAKNFEQWFLEKKEEPSQESILRYGDLTQRCVDPQILEQLNGGEAARVSLAEFHYLLQNPGTLYLDGRMNIFFALDMNGILRTLGAYQSKGGWCLCATGSDSRSDRRPIGCRIFSRLSL